MNRLILFQTGVLNNVRKFEKVTENSRRFIEAAWEKVQNIKRIWNSSKGLMIGKTKLLWLALFWEICDIVSIALPRK